MFYKLNILSWVLSTILIVGCDVTKKRNKEVAATGNTWYQKDYVYADGSANRYVFSKNSFEYFPVSPAVSSSGTYSGGSYLKKIPQLNLFYAVVDNIKSAYETRADQIETRQMGSGLIEIRENGSHSKFMIKMGSRSQLLIEGELKKIKNSE